MGWQCTFFIFAKAEKRAKKKCSPSARGTIRSPYQPCTPCGAHVCYVSPTGKRMAESIARYLCTLLPGRAEQVQKRSGLYILTETRAPWVLCECGFITNPGDIQATPEQIAECIAAGVRHYFNS